MPSIFEALQNFAVSVTSKMTQLTSGEPKDQLRNPLGAALSKKFLLIESLA